MTSKPFPTLLNHLMKYFYLTSTIIIVTCLTKALDDLNFGVAQAYMNQRKLDHNMKIMVKNFSQALKGIGDRKNWAGSFEMDMLPWNIFTMEIYVEYIFICILLSW
uniref:Uncharacterized protein n=1 Tax=Laticauda laticaudata TaxID=8630 RepID=A0A8C5SB85_LATLA